MSAGRKLLAAVFLFAGVSHFVATKFFLAIVPDYLPAHRALVFLSGAAEAAGGAGLLLPQARKAAAWGLVLLLIGVFPANVWMVQHAERYPGVPVWALWLRLPLQLPLLWWAWRYTRDRKPGSSPVQ